MKKLMIAVCCAALSAATFADDSAPAAKACCDGDKKCRAAEGDKAVGKKTKAEARKAAQKARAERKPNVLVINETTTPEQIEAYKKDVCKRIDDALAAYNGKQVAEGEKKSPVRVMLMVMDRPFGGPGMEGRRGPRGDRPGRGPRRNRPEGAPAPEAAK